MTLLRPQGLYDPRFEHDACGVGFVVNVRGVKSRDIVDKGLTILANLEHRGACGCDPLTGDGAGILLQIPHAFFKKELAAQKHRLPEPGEYGVGTVFLPRETNQRNECLEIFESATRQAGLKLIAWRHVPIDPAECGPQARAVMPEIRQIFIGRDGRRVKDQATLERKLYVVRKVVENRVAASRLPDSESFHVASLSSRTIVYKGLLISWQIPRFYQDLRDPAMDSALALVHQRFSTNTLPSWDRAHPYRFLAHNGEINTLRGNENWMHAREKMFQSALFGEDIEKIRPIINPARQRLGEVRQRARASAPSPAARSPTPS